MKVNPEAAGLDAERLERIDNHIHRSYIEPGKLPGCQVLVARHGSVGYFRSFGMADRERQAPVAADTVFRIYSMTKPITSVALMALYEEGHFSLADPVHRFIPEWRDLRVSVAGDDGAYRTEAPERPMSVRDVLMHTSGLTYGGDMRHPVDRAYAEHRIMQRDMTLAEMAATLASVPLKFQPGTRWHYSISTDICGRLVEIISGGRFDDFLRERIFEPLGMIDTGFSVPEAAVDRFAANYARQADKSLALLDDPRTSQYLAPRKFLSGGGGLVSTSADYMRFCQMLLNGGELDGLTTEDPGPIELMALNHLPGGGDLAALSLGAFSETPYEGVGFGLGFAVSASQTATQAIGSPGEYYWGGAASTIFWIDPVEDLIVIFMTQLMPSTTFNFRGQLKALVYPAIID
jgi:CubicO group peptidase (beta-lactamase class C family)